MFQKKIAPLIFICIGCLSFCQNGYGASFHFISAVAPHHTNLNGNDSLSASDFVKLSVKEFALLRGRKLNFIGKIYFKLVQKKLKAQIKNNPDTSIDHYYDQKKAKFKLDPLWFILGIIVGPFAILASFTKKESKNNKISAALGFVAFVLWFGFLFVF